MFLVPKVYLEEKPYLKVVYQFAFLDSPTDTWAPVVVTFIASKPFQVIIEAAAVDKGLHGYAALDDISFTPECKPDPTATLPVQPPDECYPDIEFRCVFRFLLLFF